VNPLFAERRTKTAEILASFTASLEKHLGEDAERVVGDHTTVYATGSGGRGEMSDASDLDLFLVRKSGAPSKLDAVVLQSAILRATRECGIEEPSADGLFLEMHSADEFANMLGNAQDDAQNKFTARMLLLLESKAVLGTNAYDEVIDRMIQCYWGRPAAAHPGDFIPFAFVNDVVRYWRVILLNHEDRLRTKDAELEADGLGVEERTERMKTERYIRSFKLRFARALTCFSAPAYLLAVSAGKEHVSVGEMKAMITTAPLERLTRAAELADSDQVRTLVDEMHELYADFLEQSAYKKSELRGKFGDPDYARAMARKGNEFGDKMFQLLTALGTTTRGSPRRLYRYMLV